MTTWITDENGNRASIEYWGSKEKAREALATLDSLEALAAVKAGEHDVKIDPTDNSTRAERAFRAIWPAYDDADPKTAVRDVLADLRHLCDLMGWDMATIDREAHDAYQYDLLDADGTARNETLQGRISALGG
jgi:hypothetical protein